MILNVIVCSDCLWKLQDAGVVHKFYLCAYGETCAVDGCSKETNPFKIELIVDGVGLPPKPARHLNPYPANTSTWVHEESTRLSGDILDFIKKHPQGG